MTDVNKSTDSWETQSCVPLNLFITSIVIDCGGALIDETGLDIGDVASIQHCLALFLRSICWYYKKCWLMLLHIVLLVTGYALVHLLDEGCQNLFCGQFITIKSVAYLSRALIQFNVFVADELFLPFKLLHIHLPQKASQKHERPIEVSFLQVYSGFS